LIVVSRRGLAAAVMVAALITPHAVRGEGWPAPAAGLSATGNPEVIFTFDDGPNPATTGRVLDTLKAHHIQATFFLVGWRFQRGDLVKTRALLARMLAEGHVVGNHTIDHLQLCGLPPEQMDHEIDGARQILERETEMPIGWFRVPYGAYCPSLVAALARNGLDHFHWDIDPQEWQGKSSKATAAYVIRHLAKLEGRAVLLMHDTKPATVAALPEILAWLDTENLRRAAAGRRPIRVMSGSDLAAERLAPTIEWVRTAALAGGSRVGATLAATVP
jgi:peptidoglycan/xylan/chitin deacetylase (PgdA/CDA1 family)